MPDVADTVITNDGTLDDYLAKIDALAREALQGRKIRPAEGAAPSEGHRSLSALVDLNKVATCQEISDQTLARNEFVRLYNVNRALKELPEFANRIERKNERLSYEPTSRAKSMLRLLSRHSR